MEEKPVSKRNWQGIASLCLGIIGVLTSLIFIVLISAVSEDLYRLILPFMSVSFIDDIGDYFSSFWLSTLSGITGLVLGIVSYQETDKRSWVTKTGIFLCSLAIMGGLPLFISMWTIGYFPAIIVICVLTFFIGFKLYRSD